MRVFVAVMHAAWLFDRHIALKNLLHKLPEVDHIQRDNDRRGAWPVARACWEAGILSGADWIIVMNDDALPCEGFLDAAKRALAQRDPLDPVCFFTAHPEADKGAEAGWYTTPDGLVGVACALSREAAVAFLRWVDDAMCADWSDDGRINLWAMAHRRRVYTTVPSLVDHQLPDESLVGNEGHAVRKPIVPPPPRAPAAPWPSGQDVPDLPRQYQSNHWELLFRTCPRTWDIEASYLVARNGVPVDTTPHVMLATPAYGGPELGFLHSRELTVHDLAQHGVKCTLLTSGGDSLVTRGRHTLMHEFLCTSATHLLFWDADIEIEDPTAVRAMLASGEDVIGCAYPFRDGSGNVVANPRREDRETQQIQIDERGIMPIGEIGTGFLLISRKAIVALCHRHPELLYRADIPSHRGAPMWALFDTALVERRYLSEDWFFCKLWRDAGHEVYAYVPPALKHWGKTGHSGHILTAWKVRAVEAA